MRGIVLAAGLLWASCSIGADGQSLPRVGLAPAFALTTQDSAQLKLADLRGKVVAVTFIFTTCKDTCPVLTAKLVSVQRKLAGAGDADIAFAAITLTPKHDTPEVLKKYAQAHGADLSHWSFLTGDAKQIHALAKQYGVFVKAKAAQDDVDHGFLTSLIDRNGIIRVQYMGTRFAPEEMLADLRALARESASP
jgi:protein SCO1